jgi:hypothetical protein
MRRSLRKDAGHGTKVGERKNFTPGTAERICKPLHETGSSFAAGAASC